MFDRFGYIQVEITEIVRPNEENIKPVKYNVICPKLKSNGKPNNKLNWNTKWCLDRIRYNYRCTFRCPIAKRIKERAKKLGRKIEITCKD